MAVASESVAGDALPLQKACRCNNQLFFRQTHHTALLSGNQKIKLLALMAWL